MINSVHEEGWVEILRNKPEQWTTLIEQYNIKHAEANEQRA